MIILDTKRRFFRDAVDTTLSCLVQGCDKPSVTTKLCSKHYMEKRRANAEVCKIDDCGNKSEALGLCKPHYLIELANNPRTELKHHDVLHPTDPVIDAFLSRPADEFARSQPRYGKPSWKV